MKSFKDVVVLIMDGIPAKDGDFFDATSRISYRSTGILEIYNDYAGGWGWPIGRVYNIRTTYGKLIVDLEFKSDLTVEEQKLIPAFNGKCLTRLANHITEATFLSVALSHYNEDSRIKPLSYYANYLPSNFDQTNTFGFRDPVFEDQKLEVQEKECSCLSLINGHLNGCPWVK